MVIIPLHNYEKLLIKAHLFFVPEATHKNLPVRWHLADGLKRLTLFKIQQPAHSQNNSNKSEKRPGPKIK